MYDPDLDDADEEWVAKKIKNATPKQNTPTQASTDALLTCPLCFSPLCYSCQRHDIYPNQFRAMFVENCKVIKTERYRTSAGKNRKKKKKDDGDSMDIAQDEASFFMVKCETCDTHVAMMDDDEVYHFFNVISS
ncbi:E2F-associated phosphoprotein [Phycomyces nitens]|nr:E2F-associated phosphoprotein [Phycomyces nitens]